MRDFILADTHDVKMVTFDYHKFRVDSRMSSAVICIIV